MRIRFMAIFAGVSKKGEREKRPVVATSWSQDIEAGDGTTSVVVIAGALLGAAEQLPGAPELRWCAALRTRVTVSLPR